MAYRLARVGRTHLSPLWLIWVASTAHLAWQLSTGQRGFDGAHTVPILGVGLLCSIALILWLPGASVPPSSGSARTRWLPFVATLIVCAGVLVVGLAALYRGVLFVLPVAALVALAFLRERPDRREIEWAACLAAVAGLAGLGAGWITYLPSRTWASLQVPLVFTCLLAGWGISRRVGLASTGAGESLLVSRGFSSALSAFGRGAVLAIPWALLNVALGRVGHDSWVVSWWQPFVAVQPAIGEEAWARVLLVSLLYLPLRHYGSARPAFAAAAAVAGYWFAYLHTSGGLDGILSAFLIGTMYSLPLTCIWLRRGLEVAIGFHFAVDFARLLDAYALSIEA
jgi:hypothetical protein